MHPRPASTSALLLSTALSMLACRGESGTQPVADSKPTAQPGSAPLAPPVPAAPAPRTGDLPAQPERVDHVTIDPRPRCGPAAYEPEDGERTAWLKTPDIQRSVFAVNSALQGFERANIGQTLDHERHAVIVVFHSDFRDYDRVRQRLVGHVAPLEVVLQPSCYPRAKLAEVEQVLLEGSWHPKAKDVPKGFWLDASFSGYRVTIDDSAPDVAEALKQRFGDLVRVSLGKPRRG